MKLATFYLPKITRQMTDKPLKLKLKSNAMARDVQVRIIVPVQFYANFIDLIPGGFVITFGREQQICLTESALHLHLPKSVFGTN